MSTTVLIRPFSVHSALAGAGRLPGLAKPDSRPRLLEVGLLLLMGIVSAVAVASVNLSLRLPGHHIIFSMFPMAVGLSLVPRKAAGTLMGAGALGALAFQGFGTMGLGAWTGLLLTGPALDLALLKARRPWHLYLGFALAGLGANAGAMAARALGKLFGLGGMGGGRGLHEWWQQAAFSYPTCGLLAGLLCAVIWFHSRERNEEAES
ncbi:hypothetical protein GETHLI_30410 [Geothrix limicola]|uniref:Energy-coupling factor transport system substrate-specific component n=1 Tax=Geothrix limicola TaxID=2927978 RepID=A0ABQ5QIY1_9BACT|nr:hypothetical protein [Geothrix limicola]GLH74539.1 hypothetical protein GETHLI_30410 [Geothrix limicola]